MKRTTALLATIALALCATAASAAPRTQKVSWTDGGKTFDGTIVWDDANPTPRPGLVLVPNWWGATDAAVGKARTLAGKDFVILVVDMYGHGTRPKNPDEAGKLSGAVLGDPAGLRSRANAALATFRAQSGKVPLDTKHIGAIGFCFGGAVALELARSGADLAGVATFHGNLSTKQPAKAGVLKAPLLVMNGADDTFVPAAQIAGFKAEMRAANADWQFVDFGGAVHCFAEPDEHNAVPGCNFNPAAYRRSVRMMRGFFIERFGTAVATR
jgi:dienelactone hydrolase